MTKKNSLVVCSVIDGDGDCPKPVYCKGMCKIHYERMQRLGTTELPKKPPPAICSECPKPAHARGLCVRHYNQWHYAQDPEYHRQRAKDWADENPEKVKERNQNRDKGEMRAYAKTYYWADRFRGLAAMANQKAKRLGAPGVLTSQAIQERFAYYGDMCWRGCGSPGTTVDHVIPFGKGGPNWPSNIRPACPPCNYGRNDRVYHKKEGKE